MRTTMLLLVASLALTGCTHRRSISAPPTPADMARFGERVAGYPAVARLVSGDSVAVAAAVSLAPTELLYGAPAAEDMIPLRQIESIRFRSSRAGGGNGAGIGILVGAGLGTVMGLANLCTECDQRAYMATVAGGISMVGLVVGSVVGSLIGSTYEYTVERPEPASP